MTDKVHPSAKPQPAAAPAAAAAGGAGARDANLNLKLPPNKAQGYNNARRPAYRPQPPPRRSHRRGCWCRCCLWTAAVILLIAVVAAVAGGVFYLIYHPHRPSFSVKSLNLSKFNLTDTTLNTSFNISVAARNPNSIITFSYDQTTVQLFAGTVGVGDGSFPSFTQGTKNSTTLRAVIATPKNTYLDEGDDASALKSFLRKGKLPIKIQMDTKIRAKIGKFEMGKLGVRVLCEGIKIAVHSGNTASSAPSVNVKCKLDPRVKILRWTI